MIFQAAFYLLLASASDATASIEAAPPAVETRTSSISSEEAIELLDRFCARKKPDRSGYDAIAWSEVPKDLAFMNTYDAPGTFLRSRTQPTVYVAHTRAGGHMNENSVEERCGIAVEGADLGEVAASLTRRAKAQSMPPLDMNGSKTTLILGERENYSVTRTSGGWLILRTMQIMIALP